MNRLFRFYEAGERSARIIANSNQWFALQILDICWFTVPRDRAKGASFTKHKIAELRFANARGIG